MAVAMLFMLMLSQLTALATAVREDADMHASLRQEAAALRLSMAQKTGTVPLKVNKAIRRAKGLASDRLRKLTAQQSEVAAKKAEAETSAKRREEMVEEVAHHAKKLSDQEEQSRAALAALEQASEAHDAKSHDFEEALAEWQKLSAKVQDLTKTVDDTELDMLAKIQAMKQDLEAKKKQLADEEAAREGAEKVMMDKKADAEAAGSLKAEHEDEKEKAEASMRAARAALADQQVILDEAVSALELAKAESSKATSQAEHLQLEQDALALLLEVRQAIEDFYTHMDTLTQSMEKSTDRQPAVPAWQLLVQDSHLKPALESYNGVVKAFKDVHSFDESLYSTIRDAVPEIKQNSWSAILLQCDPGEKMELEAEAKNDFAELQERCGTGLWKAVSLTKLRFPAFQGAAEQLDEWWDQHAGEDDVPSPADESPGVASIEEANEGPFSLGAEEQDVTAAHAEDHDVTATQDTHEPASTETQEATVPASTLNPQPENELSLSVSEDNQVEEMPMASEPKAMDMEGALGEEAQHAATASPSMTEAEQAQPPSLPSTDPPSVSDSSSEEAVRDATPAATEEETVHMMPGSAPLETVPPVSPSVAPEHAALTPQKAEEEEAVTTAPASPSVSDSTLVSLPATSVPEEEKVEEEHVSDSAEKAEEKEEEAALASLPTEAVPSVTANTPEEEKVEETPSSLPASVTEEQPAAPASSTAPLSEAQFEEMTEDHGEHHHVDKAESTPSPDEDLSVPLDENSLPAVP